MKKFKKLIPAFCAMLVSAAMLGTSTYAWFSVNKEVTATDMSVTAQSETQYFVILNSIAESGFTASSEDAKKTAPANLACGGIGGTASAGVAKAYPAAYATDEVKSTDSTYTTTVAAGNWYTGGVKAKDTNGNPNANKEFSSLTTLGEDNVTTITKTNYFVGYKFYVGLADDTAKCSAKLKFESTETLDSKVKIAGITTKLVDESSSTTQTVSYVNYVTVDAAKESVEYEFVAKTGTETKKAKYVEVIVYVYVDGTNTDIMSANISNADKLKGEVGVKVTANITK